MTVDILGLIALAEQDDTATVTFDRHYAMSPEDLWDAVTDPDRLSRWFAPVSGELRTGGTFVIHFDDNDTPTCRIESCFTPTGFTSTWPHRGVAGDVEVTVSADGEGARLRFVHPGLTKSNAPEYGAGWQAYIHRLDAHVDGTEPQDWWAPGSSCATPTPRRYRTEISLGRSRSVLSQTQVARSCGDARSK